MSMQKHEDGNKLIIPVSQGKSIKEDPTFSNIREKGNSILERVGKKKDFSSTMDNVSFTDDRFELIVDVRGFRPENLRCTVNQNSIELIGKMQETSSSSQKCMTATRNYQFQKPVIPEQAICCLSTEGLLLVTVPWRK